MPRFTAWSTLARSLPLLRTSPSLITTLPRVLPFPSTRSLSLTALRPTLLTRLPLPLPFPRIAQQSRSITYGAEYQPSQRKRKRKHGFLSRLRGGKDGVGMLRRRRRVGRRFLSH